MIVPDLSLSLSRDKPPRPMQLVKHFKSHSKRETKPRAANSIQ